MTKKSSESMQLPVLTFRKEKWVRIDDMSAWLISNGDKQHPKVQELLYELSTNLQQLNAEQQLPKEQRKPNLIQRLFRSKQTTAQ